jgi:hypothetical protein
MSQPRNPLNPQEDRLSRAFFDGRASVQRAHLALEAEERAARDLLAEATGIQDTDLLAELAGLGIRVETLSALTLIPLIVVAWADGEMDETEREAVLAGAASAGIEPGSTSYRLLEIWIEERQAPDLTNLWHDFTRALCQKLPPAQARRLKENVLGRARRVAAAAGDALEESPHVSELEEICLAELAEAFAR